MEYSPNKVNEYLKNENFSFKKKYGQNFIIDENIVNNIILKTNLKKDSLIIEVGPGSGSLTYKLCENSNNVLCYEIDETLKSILNYNLKKYDNVKIIYKDFLKCNIKEDIKNYKYKYLYFISNLPYYITTPIINKIIDDNIEIDKIVIMIQKDVEKRFMATINDKEYSALSIILNYYFDIKKVINVSKNVFMPKPNIDSIVLELNKKENRNKVKNDNLLINIIRDSFKQKRKTIKNNLEKYNLISIEKSLKELNYDLSIRAEQLSINDYIYIINNYED